MSCTSAPSTIGSPSHRYSWPGAVNSQSEPLPGLSRTPARIHALVAPSSHTSTSLETRAARHSRPSTASTMCTKRITSTAQRPPSDGRRRGARADQDRPQPGVGERAVTAGAARVALLPGRLVDARTRACRRLSHSPWRAARRPARWWPPCGRGPGPARRPRRSARPTRRTGQGIGWSGGGCRARPRPARPLPPTVSAPVPS